MILYFVTLYLNNNHVNIIVLLHFSEYIIAFIAQRKILLLYVLYYMTGHFRR